jgi:hypothetical protein
MKLSGSPMKKARCAVQRAFAILAERTGLEPATPGVTGRYSNQLNYRSAAVPASRPRSPSASGLGVP